LQFIHPRNNFIYCYMKFVSNSFERDVFFCKI